MAYFYVKAGGTASADTGRATTQRTGTWNSATADYYDALEACLGATTVPVDGDTICVSNVHTKTYALAATKAFNDTGTVSGSGLKIVSVDDANQEDYKPGASENITSSVYYLRFRNSGVIAGVSIKHDDVTAYIYVSGTSWSFQDLTLTSSTGTGDTCLQFFSGGQNINLKNVDLVCGGAAAEFLYLRFSSRLIWNGGSVSGTMPPVLFVKFGGDGGATAILNGVDLSLLSTALLPTLLAGGDDVCLLRLNNCQLHASLTLPTAGTTLPTIQQRFEMFGCDDSTGNALHRFAIIDGCGSAKNNDSVFVTANQAWYEGTDKSSIKVETTSNTNHSHPFIFELPSQYADLSSASTDKITINLVTDASLTDTDIAAVLVYPDSTTAVTPLHITSGATVGAGNYGIDPIGAGTALINTGGKVIGDWTGAAGLTPYTLVLDTNATGQAVIVSVRIEVYTDFTTASEVLYIDPILTVGT